MKSPYDIAYQRLQQITEINCELAEIEDDVFERGIKPIEPCRVSPRLDFEAKPGGHNADRAYRNGSEDEYSNELNARYGGEW